MHQEQRPRPKEMRSDKKDINRYKPRLRWGNMKVKTDSDLDLVVASSLPHHGRLIAVANPELANIIKLDLRRTAVRATQGSVWSDFIKLDLPCSHLDWGSHGRCWSSGPTRTRILSPGPFLFSLVLPMIHLLIGRIAATSVWKSQRSSLEKVLKNIQWKSCLIMRLKHTSKGKKEGNGLDPASGFGHDPDYDWLPSRP